MTPAQLKIQERESERERESENITERYRTGNGFVIKYFECRLRAHREIKIHELFEKRS